MSARGVTAEPATEQRESFPCFGSQCTVIVADGARSAAARSALDAAKQRLLQWHARFSRFNPESELALLNANPGETIPVSPLMRRIVQQAVAAANRTGGLVDPTLVAEIEQAGYATHFEGHGIELERLLELAPARAPGRPLAQGRWQAVSAGRASGTVTRPAGVQIDPGGIAKGVFADELASTLAGFDAFVVNCAGDMRLGGAAGLIREVHVESPFDDATLHTFELAAGAVATSGIGKRSWLRSDGRPAHHLLDPATGEPAFTGVVQATALAPTATEAEMLSKAAILSGREQAPRWLPHGGLLVLDDGSTELITDE